jgi:hypothetical protein
MAEKWRFFSKHCYAICAKIIIIIYSLKIGGNRYKALIITSTPDLALFEPDFSGLPTYVHSEQCIDEKTGSICTNIFPVRKRFYIESSSDFCILCTFIKLPMTFYVLCKYEHIPMI